MEVRVKSADFLLSVIKANLLIGRGRNDNFIAIIIAIIIAINVDINTI